MKIFYKLLLLFIYSYCTAEDINTQIEAIMQTSGQERVDMMNRLKSQIAAMNEEERSNALQTLQDKMQQGKSQNNILQQQMNQGNSRNFFGGLQHKHQNNMQQQGHQGQK